MPNVVFCVLLLCAAGSARASAVSPWAQFADPVFLRFGNSELPEQIAQVITSDAAGFIWIGTQAGLARFDGYHYRIFLSDPTDKNSLPDGFIDAMLADSDGGLWIGANSGGLAHYDPRTETFHAWHRDARGLTGPRSAGIFAIARESAGSLLVGGDGGLDRFDLRSHTFAPVALAGSGKAESTVHAILADPSGRVWVGTENGLYYRASASARFTAFALAMRRTASIRSLYADGTGRIWAGGESVLYVIDRARLTLQTFASDPNDPQSLEPGTVLTVAEVAPGIVWAGGNGGLSIVDLAAHRVHRVPADLQLAGGFVGGRVFTLFRDRSDLIWVGGDGGVSVHNADTAGLYVVSATKLGIGPSGVAGAKALAFSGGELWVGGYLGKLVALNPADGSISSVVMQNGLFVRKLSSAGASGLWIGAGDQLLCLLQTAAKHITCPAGPRAVQGVRTRLALETPSDVWVGTYDGLFVENKATGRVTHYRAGDAPGTLTNGIITSLLQDREGNVWAGTYRGLNEIDPHSAHVVRLLPSAGSHNAISGELISTLLEDRRGRIWAGANGSSLNVLQAKNGTMQIRHLSRSDGMPNEDVSGIAQDPGGRIWASTDRGIALFDPVSLRARALGLIDGLTSNGHWNGAVAQSGDGTIFFGGTDGVIVITPGAASPWAYMPPLVVTSITAGDRRIPDWNVNSGQPVDLPADARNLSVEFAALDYSGPQSLRYAYKLDGFNRDWIDADTEHRIATYTNLPPGKYTLRVRATNRIGVWSSHEIALTVRVVSAWYETWWFKILLTLVGLAALIGAVHWRTTLFRERQRHLEGVIAKRTQELSVANAALSIANKALMESSLTDPLTGLRNRRFLLEHIEEDIAMCVRHYEDWLRAGATGAPPDSDLIFFLVDLDHFKAVNDEYGHAAGDRVLAQMRERLEEVFRQSDYVLRWGGEEFLAVARGSRRSEASDLAERLRRAVAERPFLLDDGQTVAKTASIGFAAFPFVPRQPRAVTWSQVVELADQGLYIAKKSGRDRWFGITESNVDVLGARFAFAPEEEVGTSER